MLTRSLVGTDEWDDREILALLDEAARIKRGDGASPALPGKVLAMVFLDPSLRTRASFEIAMTREGGHAVVLEPGRGSWPIETRDDVVMDGDTVEHLREAARVLGRYADALAVRAFPKGSSWAEARKDSVIRGFVEHAGVPVVNLESARRHPCQGLADAMTLRERLEEPQGKKFVLAWAWHPKPLPTAVPASAALAAARLGMEVVVARPTGWDLDPDDLRAIEETARRNGGHVRVQDDLDAAVEGADAVYVKSWGRLDLFGEPEREKAARAGLRGWIADARLMARTRDGRGALLHCLPVRRGVEVAHEVLDGPWSAVVDEAENRLHVQRALLRRLLGGKR